MSLALFPVREPISDPSGLISQPWQIYFRDQNIAQSSSTSNAVTPIALSTQNASIGTTAFPAASLNGGLYIFTYYARITGAAGVSSSVQVSLAWTDGSIACSKTFTAITGNTTSTTGSESYMINIDPGTPVSYSTTYASNPGAAMTYDLSLVLEAIGQ